MKKWTKWVVIIVLFWQTQIGYSEPLLENAQPHPQLEQALDLIPASAWINQNQLTAHALDSLDFIGSAMNHGLDPNSYHYTILGQLQTELDSHPDKFQTVLVDGLLKLIQDLSIGRLSSSNLTQWTIPRTETDALATLRSALISDQFKNQLNQIPPSSSDYYRLQSALSQYRSYVLRGGWQEVMPMPLIRQGDTHQHIPTLRARLAVEEPQLNTLDMTSLIYEDELVEAVKRFQERHGLKVDGVIGPETISTLNISAEYRLKQIALNLDRLRWLPRELGQRYIIVNIPAYKLQAFENGAVALDMRVIVGRQKRPTPSFYSEMSHIVFNPYWNVPNKLARLDLLPKQRNDPDYFFLHNFRIFLKDNPEQEVDPYLVNWDDVSQSHFPYKLQQLPGTHNALGQMKFMFPNEWSIYLHDTSNHRLFNEHQRHLSSGCIRVEKPTELAEFSLKPQVTRDWIQEQIDSQENRGKVLKQPLPIYAVYFTVWSHDNRLFFSPDIYERDQLLVESL